MKVLITPITSSSLAHTIRGMAVGEELKKRGHKVFFTSDTSKKDFIESNGFEVIEEYKNINLNDPSDQSLNFFVDKKEGIKDWFLAEINATKKIKPSVVVTASGVLGAHQYYATKIPIVSIIDSQYLDESYGLMGLSKSNSSINHRMINAVLKPIFNKVFVKNYLIKLLDIYKDLELPTNFKTRKQFYSPMKFVIPADHVLEPINGNYNHIEHVGPIFWKGFEKVDTDITKLKLKKFKGNKLLLYLTFGGSIFNKNIYDQILTILHKVDAKFIVSIGPNFERSVFPKDNDQVIFRKYVPGLLVSEIADLIINTGSQGTVSQGLYFGKPQIAFPTTMDQSFFANRISEMGIGININKVGLHRISKRESFAKMPKDISDRMLSAVKKILSEDRYRLNAEKHISVIRSYKDPSSKAADIIEKYAL